MSKSLAGLRVLLLEDEYLIAMDVEQLCRDNGADDVTIVRSFDEMNGFPEQPAFDVAILDLMLGSVSTLDFARRLLECGTPFIFASGHSDLEEVALKFPGIAVVGKPYAGDDLISAVATAMAISSRPEINP